MGFLKPVAPHAPGPGSKKIGMKQAASKVAAGGYSDVKGAIGFPSFGDPSWWAGEPVNVEPLRGLPSMVGH